MLREESEEQEYVLFDALEKRNADIKKELTERDEKLEKRDLNLKNGMVARDNILKKELTLRDKIWLESWKHYKDSLNLTYVEAVNNRAMLESIGKRQKELVEANANILNWAMKAVTNKKKVPLPQIRISDCVPYTVVPPGLEITNVPKNFSNPNLVEPEPLAPCRVLPQDETYRTIRPVGAD